MLANEMGLRIGEAKENKVSETVTGDLMFSRSDFDLVVKPTRLKTGGA